MAFAVGRDRERRAALAIAAVTALPVLRNQQYAYVKFFVLWPVLVGVLAVRFRARHVLAAALLVFAVNGWVLASDVARGRQLYASSQAAYRRASPTSCWMTSGWAPPFHYLWPGTTTGMIATLATGIDPATQARALTASLRDCFCGASGGVDRHRERFHTGRAAPRDAFSLRRRRPDETAPRPVKGEPRRYDLPSHLRLLRPGGPVRHLSVADPSDR